MSKNSDFSHFAHQILCFVPAVYRLCATCMHILWTDYDYIECPEVLQSNFAGQGRTILRVSPPFLALIWVKMSYLMRNHENWRFSMKIIENSRKSEKFRIDQEC